MIYVGKNSCETLDINKIERIRAQQGTSDWSASIIPGATISDLSPDAIQKAHQQFTEKNLKLREEILNWDDMTFLNKAKLTLNGQITRTAVLLLGKPESDSLLNPASSKITWILKDKDNIEKDYEHFFCPLLIELEHVYAKIRNVYITQKVPHLSIEKYTGHQQERKASVHKK